MSDQPSAPAVPPRGYASTGRVAPSADPPPPLFAPPGTWSAGGGERSLYAGLPIRTAAVLLDLLPLLAVVVGLGLVGVGPGPAGAGAPLRRALEIATTVAALLVVTAVVDCLLGATPGRRLTGLRVVRAADGAPPSTALAVRRALGLLLGVLSLGVGVLWVVGDPRRQGWHDKLAGTVVLKRRP